MSRFRFRLERVRHVRAVEEGVLKGLFAEAQAALSRCEREVEDRDRDVVLATNHLRTCQAARDLRPQNVLASATHLEGERLRLRRTRERARTLRLLADQARLAWKVQHDKVAGLTRLEDRHRTLHRAEEERKDSQILDEVASRRAEVLKRLQNPGDSPREVSF